MQESENDNFPQDGMFSMFSPAMRLTQSAVLVEGGLAVLAIMLAWFAGIPLREMFVLKPVHFLIAAVAILPMLMFCRFIYMIPLKSVEFTRRFLQTVYRDFIRHCSVTQLLLVAIMSGIGEELLFRGVIQKTIVEGFGGETRGFIIGIAVTSLLFGLAHPINKLYVFLCVVIGIYLGLLFAWTDDNLIVPIIIHAFYNFIVFLAMPQLIGFPPAPRSSDG